MPPPYDDDTLPTDEYCVCGRHLWSLTECNVKWHVYGRGGGHSGGCTTFKIAVRRPSFPAFDLRCASCICVFCAAAQTACAPELLSCL